MIYSQLIKICMWSLEEFSVISIYHIRTSQKLQGMSFGWNWMTFSQWPRFLVTRSLYPFCRDGLREEWEEGWPWDRNISEVRSFLCSMQTQKPSVNFRSVVTCLLWPTAWASNLWLFKCEISGADLFLGLIYPAWEKENILKDVKKASFLFQRFLIHGPSVHGDGW